MNPRNFALVPFRGREDPPDLAITGTIGGSADALSIHYAVAGDLSTLSVPRVAPSPQRKERLWEETCLELFLGAKGSGGYWEFNLSPAGHWNVYRFTSYRAGKREEAAFSSLPFRVRTGPGTFHLFLELDLGTILPVGETVEAGVCAVLRTTTGAASHWALFHPGRRPDFHRRDGFLLDIPGG